MDGWMDSWNALHALIVSLVLVSVPVDVIVLLVLISRALYTCQSSCTCRFLINCQIDHDLWCRGGATLCHLGIIMHDHDCTYMMSAVST